MASPARRAQALSLAGLAGGGAVGALARYALSLAMPTRTGLFPWGTFVVNVSGSAVLGFLLVLLVDRFGGGRVVRRVLGTGFIGAYTTFSTFVGEAVLLVRAGRPGTAAAYVVASTLAGLGCAWVGMAAARLLVRVERVLGSRG